MLTALISGCFSLIGVFVGAHITEKNVRVRSAELSRRNAYTEVFNRAMLWADASDDAARFSLLAAVYSARLILPKEEPTYQALTKLHQLLLADADRAEVGNAYKNFGLPHTKNVSIPLINAYPSAAATFAGGGILLVTSNDPIIEPTNILVGIISNVGSIFFTSFPAPPGRGIISPERG